MKITLGGREFDLLPCPSKGLKAIGRNLREIGTPSDSGLDALVEGIYYGVKRGCMDDATFTREFCEWNIDITNIAELSNKFAEVNNMTMSTDSSAGEA